ncbi:MAG: hypothetical protein J6S97_09710 [Bacteroidales bacterium]|nr:hypothetical protein [Bacteroidales bacterium]
MAYRHHSLFTATNIRRTTSSLSASINRYIREQEKQEALNDALRGYSRLQAQNDVFTKIHEEIEELRSVENAKHDYDNLVLDKYSRAHFNTPKPSIESAKIRLEKEARKSIHSILFWKNKANREQYITEHITERLADYIEQWEADKDSFEREQDKAELAYNEASQARYNKTKKALEDFLIPSDNTILNKADSLLSKLELPFDISTKLSFDKGNGNILFDIEFPNKDFIPPQKGSLLKSGKLSIKDKTIKERNYDYVLAICGAAFKIASQAFNISARINYVSVFGRTSRMDDKTATFRNDYLYAVVFDRDTFAQVMFNFDVAPHEKFSSFPHKISLSPQYFFKTISPDSLDNATYSSSVDKGSISRSINIPGLGKSINLSISSNLPNDKSNPYRAFSANDGSGFDYLGYHDWQAIDPSSIVLENGDFLPEWKHMYIYSKSDIIRATKLIQDAYLKLRNDFINGTFYDLSDEGKTNYGFTLFFDLFSAYAAGKSDINKLCQELDILSIICGKTERYIKSTFERCFEEVSKPQEDKLFASSYFNF